MLKEITLAKEIFFPLQAVIRFLYTPRGLEPVGSPITNGLSFLGAKALIRWIIRSAVHRHMAS